MAKKTSKGRAYDQQLRDRGARLAWRVDEAVPFCWMCDRTTGQRTREHVFPRWLLDELGAADEPFRPVHRDLFGRVISARGPIPAKAFVAGQVCAACNGGWMSSLEVQVRPVLFPPSGRASLDATSQQILARWFIKTAVVLNSSQNYRLMVPTPARHALAHGIPSDFGVYLASHHQTDGQLNFGQTTGAMGVAHSEFVEEFQAASEQVYGCGLAIGDLLGVVIYAVPGAWANPTEPMIRIWPSSRGLIRWADLPEVTDITLPLYLAGRHPRFSVQNVPG